MVEVLLNADRSEFHLFMLLSVKHQCIHRFVFKEGKAPFIFVFCSSREVVLRVYGNLEFLAFLLPHQSMIVLVHFVYYHSYRLHLRFLTSLLQTAKLLFYFLTFLISLVWLFQKHMICFD